MSGGSLGGALGTAAGVALAPETGGTSMLIAPALGAAGGALGAGGKNPWSSALMGGLTGLLGGAAGDAAGIMDGNMAADATDAGAAGASGASGAAGADAASNAAASSAVDSGAVAPTGNLNGLVSPSTAGTSASGSSGGSNGGFLNNLFGSSGSSATQGTAYPAGVNPSSGGLLNSIQNSIAKNPLPYLGLGVAGIGALTPAQGNKVDPNAVLAQQKALNPNFYANLPQYNMTSQTAAPNSQNWYTYGQRPQTPIYTSQITPQSNAQGGLVQGFARGGKVCGFAMGGQPMAPAAPIGSAPPPAPPVNPAAAMTGAAGGGASPMGAPSPPSPMAQPASPLASLAGQLSKASPQQAAQVGHKLGQALRQHIIKQATFSGEGQVACQGGGQDDDVPAKLSQGEFVVPADVTAHLGDGSSDAGGQKLQKMVHNVRAHKVSHGSGFPPKAHSNPLAYVKGKKA